jgi:hypothetical protein
VTVPAQQPDRIMNESPHAACVPNSWLLLHLPRQRLPCPHGHHGGGPEAVAGRYHEVLLQQRDAAAVARQAVEVGPIEAGKRLQLVQRASLQGSSRGINELGVVCSHLTPA